MRATRIFYNSHVDSLAYTPVGMWNNDGDVVEMGWYVRVTLGLGVRDIESKLMVWRLKTILAARKWESISSLRVEAFCACECVYIMYTRENVLWFYLE